MTRVQKYSQQIKDFLEHLFALIYITSEQPACGEEITLIQHRNRFLQEQNIFVIDRQMMFVTRYHKSQVLFDRLKVILWFLLWCVGQLFTVYLTYVQLFKEDLDQQTNRLSCSDHIFYNKHRSWLTENLTKILYHKTAIQMKLKLETLDYWYVVISIRCKYISSGFI
jgi:hypothetical protein